MLICDECKQGLSSVITHTVMMMPVNPRREPLGSIDLCKGCEPIFKKKITDLMRRIRRLKK